MELAPGLTPGAAAAPSVTPSRVSVIGLDDSILTVCFDDHEELGEGSIERVMGDSGAAVSVCLLGCAREIPMSQPLEACDAANRVWCTGRARWPRDG